MERLRRLSLTLAILGLLLPMMPHALGFPHDRSCFDSRLGDGECTFFGFGAILAASLLRSYSAARTGEAWRGWLWGGLAFVAVDVFLIPFEIALMPHWYWDVFR